MVSGLEEHITAAAGRGHTYSVLTYLGYQLLERLELLLVDELELFYEVVVVLEQGVGVRLRLELR